MLIIVVLIRLCSHPVCWLWPSLLQAACCLRCVCWHSCNQQFRSRAWFEFDCTISRVQFESYWPLRKFRRQCVFESYSERCLSSDCRHLSYLCVDILWNFSASLLRNGNVVVQRRTSIRACRVDVNVVDHRRTPSRAVSHRRGRWCSMRTVSSTITGSSWNVIGSGRVVPSHLIGSYRFIWSRLLIVDTPSEQLVTDSYKLAQHNCYGTFQDEMLCAINHCVHNCWSKYDSVG